MPTNPPNGVINAGQIKVLKITVTDSQDSDACIDNARQIIRDNSWVEAWPGREYAIHNSLLPDGWEAKELADRTDEEIAGLLLRARIARISMDYDDLWDEPDCDAVVVYEVEITQTGEDQ